MNRHLIKIDERGAFPHWAPGTAWAERRLLARAWKAFRDGLDPRCVAPGWYRVGIGSDGNLEIGGRVGA